MDMATTPTCKKCNGTGYLPHFAHSDGGKCWACTDKADTSYTRTDTRTDEEVKAAWEVRCAELRAARRAPKG